MSTKRPLVSVIGSLNIDYVTTTPRCPGPGETLTATSLVISAGGKGANQAVGCGRASFQSADRQDFDVEMIGAVGKDDIYVQKLLLPMLQTSGVNTEGVIRSAEAQTGTASIVVESQSGENRIMVVPGANHLGMSDVDEVLARTVRGGREPDVVVMQGEIPRETVLALLQRFNRRMSQTKIIFNPAPVFPDGIPLESLQGLSVLVVNETEAIMLGRSFQHSGFNTVNIQDEAELADESNLLEITKQFHSMAGIELILITLGSRGAFFSDIQSDRHGLVPGVKVAKVVDTTAAGDTFVGYIAAALARDASEEVTEPLDIVGALRRASEAAAKCVQRSGAMQSIPFGYE